MRLKLTTHSRWGKPGDVVTVDDRDGNIILGHAMGKLISREGEPQPRPSRVVDSRPIRRTRKESSDDDD